ncbi:MAG: hypothetical protein QNJ44_09030 [Rhodobacter sp.]|nr:hypothetical protein [Rhodobacter sp.]
MFPFLVNTNNYEFPLSGDVTQDISPSFFAAMEGVPEIEREVVTKVASYGDQLGALTDAVLVLAEKCGVKGKEVDEVKRIAREVADAKARVTGALRNRAETSLRRLKAADPEAHRSLTGAQK